MRWFSEVKPNRATAKEDLVAGLPGAISSVPDGMAASVLAGVNPVYGLYASGFGPIAGGLTSNTRLGATFVAVIDEYAERLHRAGGRLYLGGVDPDMMRMLECTNQINGSSHVRAFPATATVGEATTAASDAATTGLIAAPRGDPCRSTCRWRNYGATSRSVFEPDDFEDYWATAIADAAKLPLDVEVRPADSVVSAIDVFDVHFTGHGGARIAAWLYVPPNVEADTPVVVEFVGYGGGRGRPAEWLNWSCAGFPHLVMDSRGQGGGWRGADTADVGASGEPGAKGFLTSGLAGPAVALLHPPVRRCRAGALGGGGAS